MADIHKKHPGDHIMMLPPNTPRNHQQFGAQRLPELLSLFLISFDANNLPLPGALHANTGQTVL